MSDDGGTVTLYSGSGSAAITGAVKAPFSIKVGCAHVLRGGAIVAVSDARQAKIAENAGACAVVVVDPAPPPAGGVGRMTDPGVVRELKLAVSIPVIARARIGHFVEAQILETVGADYVDESEALTPADEQYYINKHSFRAPFFSGCRDLGEALRRIREGAAVIRTVEVPTAPPGDVAAAVRAVRAVLGGIRQLSSMDDDEVFTFAKRISAPYDIVAQTKQLGRLPVGLFAAGGVATPADAGLMMQLGCDGVFVGSDVFDGDDAFGRVQAIVRAVREYNDAHALAEASCRVRVGQTAVEQLATRVSEL